MILLAIALIVLGVGGYLFWKVFPKKHIAEVNLQSTPILKEEQPEVKRVNVDAAEIEVFLQVYQVLKDSKARFK